MYTMCCDKHVEEIDTHLFLTICNYFFCESLRRNNIAWLNRFEFIIEFGEKFGNVKNKILETAIGGCEGVRNVFKNKHSYFILILK